MTLITNTAELKKRCENLKNADFLTIDTEFMREKTYWAKLCLIQVAGPHDFFAIDPLAKNIDLSCFYDLMQDESILKVFHAARQDIEIFVTESGSIPTPLFDTQIAGMVCGFGDQISYENLIKKLCNKSIDKTSRFTDWSQRPLSDKQLKYALSDVTYLRDAYLKLKKEMDEKSRHTWIEDELAIITNKKTYLPNPENLWKRVKISTKSPKTLAVLRELAIWREGRAQDRNIPRTRVLRDDALSSLALHLPRSLEDLQKMRNINRNILESESMRIGILDAVEKGLATPDNECPKKPQRPARPQGAMPVIELLRVLLKSTCEEENVAPKLLACAADLEKIATYDNPEVPAMSGWRYDIFGKHAEALKQGKLAFTLKNNDIKIIKL